MEVLHEGNLLSFVGKLYLLEHVHLVQQNYNICNTDVLALRLCHHLYLDGNVFVLNSDSCVLQGVIYIKNLRFLRSDITKRRH